MNERVAGEFQAPWVCDSVQTVVAGQILSALHVTSPFSTGPNLRFVILQLQLLSISYVYIKPFQTWYGLNINGRSLF